MREQSVGQPGTPLTVLSVSPFEEDHRSLQAIIGQSKWILLKAGDLVSTLVLLQQHEVAVVLCERHLLPGTWADVLEHINTQANIPSLIVASRLADERLWAEALSLGAWDVLAKPFDRSEVIRSVHSAWRRWRDRMHMHPAAVKMAS